MARRWKAPAPAEGQAAKKPASAPAAGPATKIDSIFNKLKAAAKPVPEPVPETRRGPTRELSRAGAKAPDGRSRHRPDAGAGAEARARAGAEAGGGLGAVGFPDLQVPAVAGGTTEVPVSIYFTEGDPELVPRQGDDGSVVGFDAVRSTRKARGRSRAALLSFLPPLTPARPPHRRPQVLFDAGTPKKVLHYTLSVLRGAVPDGADRVLCGRHHHHRHADAVGAGHRSRDDADLI